MSFQAPFSIMDYARLRMLSEQEQQQQQRQNQQLLMSGLQQLGGAVKDYYDQKSDVAAMDKGVGLMSDIGAISPDVRDKFMNLDRGEKPFVFDLLRQGMFAPYAAGQSAVQQARGWAENRGAGGGGMPGGARNQYGYFYQGP